RGGGCDAQGLHGKFPSSLTCLPPLSLQGERVGVRGRLRELRARGETPLSQHSPPEGGEGAQTPCSPHIRSLLCLDPINTGSALPARRGEKGRHETFERRRLWSGPEGAKNRRAVMPRSAAMSMSAFSRGCFAAGAVVWMVVQGAHAQTPDVPPVNAGANPYRV